MIALVWKNYKIIIINIDKCLSSEELVDHGESSSTIPVSFSDNIRDLLFDSTNEL